MSSQSIELSALPVRISVDQSIETAEQFSLLKALPDNILYAIFDTVIRSQGGEKDVARIALVDKQCFCLTGAYFKGKWTCLMLGRPKLKIDRGGWKVLGEKPQPHLLDSGTLTTHHIVHLYLFMRLEQRFKELGAKGGTFPITENDFDRLDSESSALQDAALVQVWPRIAGQQIILFPQNLAAQGADAIRTWILNHKKEFLRTNILYLQDLNLKVIPKEIFTLENLEELNVRKNQLTFLPKKISALKNLIGLSLQDNQLTALPFELCKLSNLSILLLERNQLSALPAQIINLRGLHVIHLVGNHATAVPPLPLIRSRKLVQEESTSPGNWKSLDWYDVSLIETLKFAYGHLKLWRYIYKNSS